MRLVGSEDGDLFRGLEINFAKISAISTRKEKLILEAIKSYEKKLLFHVRLVNIFHHVNLVMVESLKNWKEMNYEY